MSDDVTPRFKAPRDPKPRARVRSMSRQRRRDLRRRAEVLMLVEQRDGRTCAAAGVLPGQCRTLGGRKDLEGHEVRPRGRQPGSWLDPDQIRLVCPFHHDLITDAHGPLLEAVVRAGLLLPAEPLPGPLYRKETAR